MFFVASERWERQGLWASRRALPLDLVPTVRPPFQCLIYLRLRRSVKDGSIPQACFSFLFRNVLQGMMIINKVEPSVYGWMHCNSGLGGSILWRSRLFGDVG